MGFFTVEFSEPSVISSLINKIQHVLYLLFAELGALMMRISMLILLSGTLASHNMQTRGRIHGPFPL